MAFQHETDRQVEIVSSGTPDVVSDIAMSARAEPD
jgi:hypothetical protein